MTDEDRIARAKVNAAEEAVIASIPKWLRDGMERAQAEFRAKGGCPGCGSMVLACHSSGCAENANDLY